jgi:hypothetical protein
MARRLLLSSVAVLAATTPAVADSRPFLGVMLDLGAPDGANVALVAQPLRSIRLEAGAGHNAIAPCARGGVALAPLSTFIRPTVSAHVGRCREGDANPLARAASGDSTYSSEMLERVGYDYATARVGLELGSERVTFFLHAGATRMAGRVRDASTDADEMSSSSITFTQDPTVTLTTLSARLGFIVFFK